ncbi:MAG: NCS1 family nucleobase:cation symporter-1 [Candidatus Sericytochromatia bacterium]|nr:NCS1 family nucleobase:cation symporter-1 [Candidatus Sericytochromatia bacterium]
MSTTADTTATLVASQSPLYSDDLAPTPPEARTWRTRHYTSLWVAMACCIPTYMLASGLIASGMNWRQALFTILLGNLLVLIPILLNSHPGTRYGIPFPVFARASFGVWGANLPALMRALVACGWFGINAWIGGAAVNTLLTAIWPGWAGWGGSLGGYALGAWVSFGLFWLSNIWIIYRGMDTLKRFESWAAPFVLLMTAGLVIWAVKAADGLGPLMAQPGKFTTLEAFWPVFVPSLTAMVGFWATLSLNMPDFTRFAADQKSQVRGQVLGLPAAMTVFSAMGIVITSASSLVFGKLHWDPVQLVGEFQNPWVVAIAMFTVIVATISVNIAANVVSPANDFANMWPKRIDFKTGGLITGILGIAIMPWRLLADAQAYIFDWLLVYSGGLGSVAGVMIVDYWLLRRCELDVPGLYETHGRYRYWRGWNLAGVAAALAGCFAAWGGKLIPALSPLVPYGWFAGFAVAGLSYAVFMGGRRGATSD